MADHKAIGTVRIDVSPELIACYGPDEAAKNLTENFRKAYEANFEASALAHLSRRIHKANVEKGFWPPEKHTAQGLATAVALMHSEVSELLEELREPERHQSAKIPGFSCEEEELADLIIRALDYAEARGFGGVIGAAIQAKLRYNASRPMKHGKRF